MATSIHRHLKCQECHGGPESFAIAPDRLQIYKGGSHLADAPAFDHGADFKGKLARSAIPHLCGDCHADAERMNPYGIRIDQLARYWTSVHGKTLMQEHDDRVAVCVDCHGAHDVLPAKEPASKTYPSNVPGTCAQCHENARLMGDFDLPTGVVEEYRRSVHGRLLLEDGDLGAPTCATCHGNHSAVPPGFENVGAVCGQCHQHASEAFAESPHAGMDEFKGCVQCHAYRDGGHFHLIERITKDTGVLIERYEHLLASDASPTPEQITNAIHPDPQTIMRRALPGCLYCHDDVDEDADLAKMFTLLDEISAAERQYVRTGYRLDEVERGVLLVDRQRFLFSDAKTQLIELAPTQHTLDSKLVTDKVAELNETCNQVEADLDKLERDLRLRHLALIPIWIFALGFAGLLYAKYKRLRTAYVKPESELE
ncbi:MAG: hypothetical protein J5J06_02485 [Phycisphaerae bacterium]|nr:hypothetical protein [Phycisphaerae bacterium]